jgi:hypothetical protein
VVSARAFGGNATARTRSWLSPTAPTRTPPVPADGSILSAYALMQAASGGETRGRRQGPPRPRLAAARRGLARPPGAVRLPCPAAAARPSHMRRGSGQTRTTQCRTASACPCRSRDAWAGNTPLRSVHCVADSRPWSPVATISARCPAAYRDDVVSGRVAPATSRKMNRPVSTDAAIHRLRHYLTQEVAGSSPDTGAGGGRPATQPQSLHTPDSAGPRPAKTCRGSLTSTTRRGRRRWPRSRTCALC